MKKTLLSLATVLLGTMAMSAEEVITFDFNSSENIAKWGYTAPEASKATSLDAAKPLVNGKVSLSVKQNTSGNADQDIRFWNSKGSYTLRNSASGTDRAYVFTSTGDNITKVEFNASDFNMTQGGTKMTGKTWTGNAASVEFVPTGKCYISSVTVTLGGEGGDTPTPPEVETEGDGTEAKPYTVADVFKLDNPGTTAWVKGVIVGVMNYVDGAATDAEKYQFSTTVGGVNTNFVIAATDKDFGTNYVTVQLTKGAVRDALNLVANPGNMGKEVSLLGELTSYMGPVGVRNVSDFNIEGYTPPVVETEGEGTEAKPYTIADVIKLNNNGAKAWVKGIMVGVMVYDEATKTSSFSAEVGEVSTNLVLAATDKDFGTNYVAVQLPKGNVRDALNLVSNPANKGKEVSVYGELSSYMGAHGVYGTSDFKLEGYVPPVVDTEGQGTQLDPFTVADVIKLNNSYTQAAWVSGYIVGSINGKSLDNAVFGADPASNTNLLLAAKADEKDVKNCIPVALPVGKLRNDLNLVDRPALIGREVSILGKLVAYFVAPGLKEGTDYTIVGSLPEIPVSEVASLTEFIEEQNTTTMFKITGDVTVFYQSPDQTYTFITDGDSNIEVYGKLDNAYVNGDKLSGIIGKFGYYQNMPQMSPDVASFGTAVKGTAVEPVKATDYASILPNDYVLIEGATITETTTGEGDAAKTTFTITDGTTELTVFDRFKIEGLQAAEGVNILAIGAVYGETKQIFPISIYDPAGISEITAGAKAATAVYDLQGRRLAAPVKGINIINGKKVLVK